MALRGTAPGPEHDGPQQRAAVHPCSEGAWASVQCPYGTYNTIRSAVEKGHLRPPIVLPNGFHAWQAGHVVEDFGLDALRHDKGRDE